MVIAQGASKLEKMEGKKKTKKKKEEKKEEKKKKKEKIIIKKTKAIDVKTSH